MPFFFFFLENSVLAYYFFFCAFSERLSGNKGWLRLNQSLLLLVNRSWKDVMGFLQLNVTNQNSELDFFFFHWCLVIYLRVSVNFPYSLWLCRFSGKSPVCIHYLIWMLWFSGPSLLLSAATQMAFTCLTPFTGVYPGLCRMPSQFLVIPPPLSHSGWHRRKQKWKRAALSHSRQLFHF